MTPSSHKVKSLKLQGLKQFLCNLITLKLLWAKSLLNQKQLILALLKWPRVSGDSNTSSVNKNTALDMGHWAATGVCQKDEMYLDDITVFDNFSQELLVL